MIGSILLVFALETGGRTVQLNWSREEDLARPELSEAQRAALEAWVQEYRGDLGTALTDPSYDYTHFPEVERSAEAVRDVVGVLEQAVVEKGKPLATPVK